MGTKENNKKANTHNKKSSAKMGLMIKILGVVAIPLLLIIAISSLSLRSVSTKISDRLSQHELNTATFSLSSILNTISDGDYSYKNGNLYKGDTNVSNIDDAFDEFLEQTDLDATIIVGKTRIITTIINEDGNRAINTDIDDKVYNAILNDGSYFANDLVIQGIKYKGYYALVDDSNSGAEVIIFSGIKASVAHEIYYRYMIISIIIVISIAVLSAIVISLLIFTIVKDINVAVHNLDKVSSGELNFIVSDKILKRTDEVGNIARSIHSLLVSLATIITNITNSSASLNDFSSKFKDNFESINNSISNVNIAVEEIANGATNQANETQNVNTQINDMGDAIDSTTKNISSLTSSTDTMKSQNSQVNSTLEALIAISDRTKESINEVHKQTNNTNQSASEIGEAINIITDIASQTNLLSLNASIEAARAGEHGRGFAVVADEIRQLADQSSESADKISHIVSELIRNSNTSVETMEQVLTDINDQFDKLNTTKQAFNKLNTEVNNVAAAIVNISDEIDSINTVKNEVLGSVESLAAIAEQNAASTQETSAAMFELGQIVNDCNESTSELVTLSDEMNENASKFRL